MGWDCIPKVVTQQGNLYLLTELSKAVPTPDSSTENSLRRFILPLIAQKAFGDHVITILLATGTDREPPTN